MSLLQRLGIVEEPKEVVKSSFEEIVRFFVNPSVREIELSDSVRNHIKQCAPYPSGYAALSLAHLAAGRSYEAWTMLSELEENHRELFLGDGIISHWFAPNLTTICASYAAFGKGELAKQYLAKNDIKQIKDDPECSLVYFTCGDIKKSRDLVQRTLRSEGKHKPVYFDWRRAITLGQDGIVKADYFRRDAVFAIALFCLGEEDLAKKMVRGLDLRSQHHLTGGCLSYYDVGDGNVFVDIEATAFWALAHALINGEKQEPTPIQRRTVHPYR